MNRDPYELIAESIVKYQYDILGPLALMDIETVSGLVVDPSTIETKIIGNSIDVVNELVRFYDAIFGKVSVSNCRAAARRILAELNPDQIPQALRG